MTADEQAVSNSKEETESEKVVSNGPQSENQTPSNGKISSETYVPRKYESTLGFWKFRPDWLQRFSSIRYYVLIYGLFGTSQQMFGSYFVATISTIEKRFRIPSKTSGLIASCWDVGGLFASMCMAYFGSHGYKTRWLATGGIIAGISGYLRFLPHIIYGSGEEALQYDSSRNLTRADPMCDIELKIDENCHLESDAVVTVVILCLAHIFLGIGTSAYYTLGAAYLDDNARKNRVPLYFAISTAIRMVGPTIGFFLASYSLNIFVEPSVKPPFDRDDARWIGAWWLGWVPIGTCHIIMSCLMTLFPRTFPSEVERRKKDPTRWPSVKKKKSIKDFLTILNRLVRNPVLMFNSFSSTFYIFGMMAYWIFMPKYIETQFRKSASVASLVTGSVGLLCTAAGVLVSGSVVSYFRPRPTYLAWWNVFTESLDVVGHLAFAFISCVKDDLHGVSQPDGTWNLTLPCNAGCDCSPSIKYNPVCSFDGSTTYYSPCHAGCTSFEVIDSKKMFYNCSCVPDTFQAIEGPCPADCHSEFMWFLILLCTMQFFAASGRAGNTVIQFRSVAPEDKAISIALLEALVCLIAFIPSPIIFGALLDSTCLVWGETCGVTGNCWLYHGQSLRYLLNMSAAGLILIGTLCDVGVAFCVKNLKIYDEHFENKDNEDGENINPLLLMAG